MSTTESPKLRPGDIITIVGWPMLANLENGARYRIHAVRPSPHGLAYDIANRRGRIIARHLCRNVDGAMIPSNANRIDSTRPTSVHWPLTAPS